MLTQKTPGAPVSFEGVGLHTGAQCGVDVRPAAVGAGISFVLAGGVRVPATAEYVVDTSRATVLGSGGATVSTVEHLLSALWGMGASNAEIVVRGSEIPVVDGSAATFAQRLHETGLLDQGAPRDTYVLEEPFEQRAGDRAFVALPGPALRVRFVADFPPPVGAQFFQGEIRPEEYLEEIARARTFGYLHEVEALRARGLALGGSLDNAVVFGPDGPLQPLYWPNEVVRHKVLDLLGDLALLGAWPQFDIIAIKSGHAMHAAATRALREKGVRRG